MPVKISWKDVKSIKLFKLDKAKTAVAVVFTSIVVDGIELMAVFMAMLAHEWEGME